MRTPALALCLFSALAGCSFQPDRSTPADVGVLYVGDFNTEQIQALDRAADRDAVDPVFRQIIEASLDHDRASVDS